MRFTSRQNILMLTFCAVSCAGLLTGSYLRAQTPTTMSDLAIFSVTYENGQQLPPVANQVVAMKVIATNNVGTSDVSFLSALYPSTLQAVNCIPYTGQSGVSTCLLPPLVSGQQMSATMRFRVLQEADCGQSIPIIVRVFNSMTDVNAANNTQVFNVAMPACPVTSSSSSSTSNSSSSSSVSTSSSSAPASSSSAASASSASSNGTVTVNPLQHAIALRQLFAGIRNTYNISQGQAGYDATFDFGGDGTVGFDDFLAFSSTLGLRCGGSSVATQSAVSSHVYGAFLASLGSQTGNAAYRFYFDFNGNGSVGSDDIPYMNQLMAHVQECILAAISISSSSSSI